MQSDIEVPAHSVGLFVVLGQSFTVENATAGTFHATFDFAARRIVIRPIGAPDSK
jgi:hypothetical protein